MVNNLGSGFKCYSNMHKLVSRPLVLRLNISIYQGPVDKVSNSASCLHTTGRTCSLCYKGDSEIQGIKLPGGKDGEYIETKLCMFADDTLFYKNDESVKKSFDILTIYEKASGSKVNY